ncbi:S-layer homology domain-containing protein [Paenibacillus humicola]|uniref:S-layer homology domain-containing protein n=1 Tax=Paenibacillus humicola TaxID=3110540 RepID=UPI00237B0B5D|nr:S-layer homology domain-containing protein [Paenibacillus humicola]
MQHSKWFKTAAAAVVFSLLSGGVIAGVPSASAAAAGGFTDVPASHWAAKPILKLSLQGIVQGNNGKFMPNDNITQQEAITMVLRFMDKEADVQQDNAIVFPDSFKVDNFFKPYVVLALQLNLIDQNTEFKLAEQNPSSPWGERKASREWITKLIVRAIGQTSLADSLAASPAAFSDKGKIDDGYAGYINAAVSLKLVNGVTPDTFEPQSPITRAAMATLLSRAESQYPVQYPGETTGVLSGEDENSVSVYANSAETSFDVADDTYVYRYDSDKPTTLDKLDPNTKVDVIANGNQALYIEQLDGEQQVKKIDGTFDRIVPSENKLWMWVGDEPVSVIYDSKLTATDASGASIPLSSLVKDSNIEVQQDTYRPQPQAVAVTVQSAPVNKSGQGVVTGVDQTGGTVTITDSASGTAETLNVSPRADIVWQGTLLTGGLSQIQTGDTIAFDVDNSVVTRITIQMTSAKTITGKLVSISTDTKTVNYTRDGSSALEAKFLADAVTVQINGLTGTSIADLSAGDQVQLSLDDQGKVSSIKVLNRQVQQMNGASIVYFDPDTNALLVNDDNGNALAVTLSDATKIDYNGNMLTLSAAESLFTKNRKVTIGFTNGKAVSVQFVFNYTGKVVTLDRTNNQLTLLLSNGSNFTIPLDSYPAVQIMGNPSATLADVNPGDTVTALLNATQDKVSAIQVQTTVQAQIAAVDAANNKLTLNIGGQTSDWAAGSLAITDAQGNPIALSNLVAGQTGSLTYTGSTPTSFQTVAVTIGKINAVSTNALTLADGSGNTSVLPLGTAYTVNKNGVTGNSASALQSGDWVEVHQDAGGQTVVTAIAGLSKKFWKYDTASGVLSVQRANLNDSDYQYKTTAATKYTQGNAAISVSQLMSGDSVTLYVYNGVVLEVVKSS